MVITNEFVFFWKSPLGQWNKIPFKDNENITYNCAEQYMMAKKALLFKDNDAYTKIMQSTSPEEQQKLGSTFSIFNDISFNLRQMYKK